MVLPILDPAPSGKPHDYSLRAIHRVQMMKAPVAAVEPRPIEWHNPNQKYLVHRDQKDGGTCTGQAACYGMAHNYIRLTGDIPTAEQMAKLQRDVIDSLGSLVDILPPHEFSSECAYQMGRDAGKVTYPSGGEIRFVAKAMRDYGIVLESQWHSDKLRTKVWNYPPGARETSDGGLSPEDAAKFASNHRIKGWAMVGSPDGDATWDEICDAIYRYGWVMCAIPVYTNYTEMQGQEVPVYPNPQGCAIGGFHAQCVDGYSPAALDIEHSWREFCGQHGLLPVEYYNYARSQCVWLVYIDEEETLIGEEIHTSCNITCNTPAIVSVDGIVVGPSPQKIAIEKGVKYIVKVSAEGFASQEKVIDDGTGDIEFTLTIALPPSKKTWWMKIIDWIIDILKIKRD